MIRILIIEDVDSMRALLEKLLEGVSGVQVTGSVGNLRDAELELLRRRPEVVLLDEILPGESIGGFIQVLVEEKIPVLLMTSMENPSHALPEGVVGRLTKPGWRSFDEDRERFKDEIKKIRSLGAEESS